MPFTVGVTGGIGSGKSAVTDRLAALGITVVDADRVARQVVEPGTDGLRRIVERYGDEILLADGTLDRRALRERVFADPAERRWLEQLTHPLIGAEIQRQLAAAASSYVVLSSPLLLETSQRSYVDHVVVVDVPEATQVARTVSRDDNPEQLVRQIMAAQMARSERLALADIVIDNTGSLADLDAVVRGLHTRLLAAAAA